MSAENLQGWSIVTKANGSEPRYPKVHPSNPEGELSLPQNKKPIEIFNGESSETQKPSFPKTYLMRRIEERYGGKPIKEILSELYWDQKKSFRAVAEDLGVAQLTVFTWIHATGVGVRSVNDVVRLVWEKWRESGEMTVRNVENNHTQIKYREAKERLGIESDTEFKKYLENMYRQHRSLRAMAKEFRDREIDVSRSIIKNWISHLGIQLIDRGTARLEKNNKRFVEKAYNTRAFWSLTPDQRDALRLRYIEGRTFRESASITGVKNRQAMWDRANRGLNKLKKIRPDLDIVDS